MNKKTPQEELSDLRKLVSERNQNPLLLFKRPQSRKAYYDPRGMEMDLGNDAIRAATIAFENLGKVVANANQWLDKEDFNYEKRASLYGEIINQADEYVKHVLQQVGGIYLNDSYQGDSSVSYTHLEKGCSAEHDSEIRGTFLLETGERCCRCRSREPLFGNV